MAPLKHRVTKALAHRRKMQAEAAARLQQLAAQRKVQAHQDEKGSAQ